ncbi:hypothetical protein [Pseudomonas sp. NFACC05-1]|uniref:hypothetical protein n=1 Tax=Pseudomonas sp. NFACC05-1 TaxID=1566241 RepID=UPI000871821F|nr:hypothetical protein [Pseudomonas sp. NFACC05-1]SCW91958.1 hypothetical protein SAMN03159424_04403 [Pseudomonas sp. NFACC05-1]
MNIDWSKAPEWAQALGKKTYPNGDQSIAWINGDGYNFNVKMGKNASCHFFNDKTACADFEVVEFRPGRIVQPWTGEGLPPVGTVCELSERVLLADSDASDWFEAGTRIEIGGHATFNGATGPVCVVCVVDENFTGTISKVCLRPIRTPEQIEAEARAKAIDAMVSACPYPGSDSTRIDCAALYDASYRKFEIVDEQP